MKTIEDMAAEGAWRFLCINMLSQAVANMKANRKLYKPGTKYRRQRGGGISKASLHYRNVARDWMDGGVGTVTFEECCEAVGVNPDRARDKIAAYCHSRKNPHLS